MFLSKLSEIVKFDELEQNIKWLQHVVKINNLNLFDFKSEWLSLR